MSLIELEKKYRILLVIRWPVGGIRTFIHYVYRNFDFHKYSFSIIAPDLPELRILLSDLDFLEVSYIAVDNNPSNISFFRAVSKAIMNGKFDLVHSHGFTAGISSVLGSVFTHTSHIVTLHEVLNDIQFSGFKGHCKKITMSFLLPLINVIHLVSYDALENILAYFGILKAFKKKLFVIPNGIEVEKFLNASRRDLRKELNLPKEAYLIGFLGRFMPAKGFRYLVDAVDLLCKEHSLPKKPVVLAFGEGAFIREYKKYVMEKGLDKIVYFMPFIPDVVSTLKGLDVVAMPSLWEACGLVAIEAMVSGVPLIGTDCIGLREVLKDTTATIVPQKDSHALAKALMKEMNNPSQLKAKSFTREAARRFDVKKQSGELEKVFLSFLKVKE